MGGWSVEKLEQGVKYAVEGIILTLKNPHIRQKKFLRILITLGGISIALYIVTHLVVTLPLRLVSALLFALTGPGSKTNESMEGFLGTTQRTINEMISYIPVLALLFMRNVYPKPLDDLFMESLRYIDERNGIDTVHGQDMVQHTPGYIETLERIQTTQKQLHQPKQKKDKWKGVILFLKRTWKQVRYGLFLFLLSLIPVVGRYVFPVVGAYSTFKTLGKTQGVVVGICFLFLPRWATMKLVRTLIGMRSLVRELLEPYFSRMRMSHEDKLRWFSGRKDLIFGFSLIAYLIIRVPYIGFINYGIAQCAVGYILTKVVDPNTLQPIDFKSLKQQSSDDDLSLKKEANHKLD